MNIPARGVPTFESAEAQAPRVMIVADHLGYPGGVVHGVTTYFVNVLPELSRAGVKLTVCFLRDPHAAADELRERGIEPVFLSAARNNPFVALQIAVMARRNGCTILHAMGIKGTLMARLASRLTPTKVVLHLHDLVAPNRFVGQLQRFFARPDDMAVCVSSAIVPIAVRRYGVRPDRVRVVHNGVNVERFRRVADGARARLRATLGIDEDRPVVLMAGRMHPIKGHRAMLQMMPSILHRCPSCVLLLAGDGPERGACESLVRDLRLERSVQLLGQRRDMPELLHACDLVVMPSESEGFPLAAVEAFAVGRPVVAFNCGGLGDLLQDGFTGFLVTPGANEAFAEATASLLLDGARRAEFGANARAAAAGFSLERHVRQLLTVYEEALTSVGVRTAPVARAGGARS